MFEVEDLLCALTMISIEMSESNNINLIVVLKTATQLFLEIAAPVIFIVRIAHVCEIEQCATPIAQLNEAAISVANWKETNGMH